MSIPERQPTSDREQLQAALHYVQRRLEINDENENQMERTAYRDQLLEQQDDLIEALSSLDVSSDPHDH
jgi:hypothetical protein